MSADPRNANSLNEAALNPGGTYNGVKALSWLSAVLHPGKGLSEAEVTVLAEEAKKRAAAKVKP